MGRSERVAKDGGPPDPPATHPGTDKQQTDRQTYIHTNRDMSNKHPPYPTRPGINPGIAEAPRFSRSESLVPVGQEDYTTTITRSQIPYKFVYIYIYI